MTKIEIFDNWVAKNKAKIDEMILRGGYPDDWARQEIKSMRVKIIGFPEGAPKKYVGKFIAGWFIRGWRWHHELKNPLTKQQEDDHYAKQRRTGSNKEFTKI